MDNKVLENFSHYCEDSQFFECIIQSVYEAYVEEGNVVVDGGANRGRHSIPLGKSVGTEGKVYAVEALPHLAKDLKQNTKQFRQINVVDAALAEFSGTTEFCYVKNSDYYSGIKQCEYPFDPDIEKLNVSAICLDELVPKAETVAFMKLDLEGGEFDALKGGRRILEKDRPLIIFEYSGNDRAQYYNYEIKEMERFWFNLNYRVFDVFGHPIQGNGYENTAAYYLLAAGCGRSLSIAENLHIPLIRAAQQYVSSYPAFEY